MARCLRCGADNEWIEGATKPEPSGECIWKEWDNPDNGGEWNTSCGETFTLIDGTPKQNKMNFCTYCGKRLVEEPISHLSHD